MLQRICNESRSSIGLATCLWAEKNRQMAANYWESSQRRRWQFTREGLEDLRKKLEDEDPNLVQGYPLPQLRHLSIYFNQPLMAILLALVLRPNQTGVQSAGNAAGGLASAAHAALSSAGSLKSSNPDKANGSSRTKVQRLASWLAESNIDIEAIVDCTQEIISFYEVQEQYNEKLTREQINRFVKARSLDK
ncbi:putative RNA polymerase II holoenzyme cyclin-like subunit [Glarea lozoyensis 74030]|uniref:Putative RNA polymerase II holoenzyme cyclin-like subunit n=1 Tax=Glarea lozoyensis (strain ATCC 74030 / MF5533) TaxID=1104152 RepID=H0EV00_GLAL7|nr:putative RNA polymerase II holoenzyme cyclin-like subunit [Glarea lozoyensis 74030]